MNDPIERIDFLDTSIYDTVPSQTAPGCRRSLLAVQRAVARWHGDYVYLEIGSHLGGSIQPHLVDGRCKKIYSVDPRPVFAPDDRAPGHTVQIEDNSSARMLSLLNKLGKVDLKKIECIEKTSSEVDPGTVNPAPHLAFIDGEHTQKAVLADFQFCRQALHPNGAILLHDFYIIHPAIAEIRRMLDRQKVSHLAFKLEDDLFGFFFTPDLVASDWYLRLLLQHNRYFLQVYRSKVQLKKVIPDPLLKVLLNLKHRLSPNPL